MVFIPRKKVIKSLENKFNSFFWKGKDKRVDTSAKVAWSLVCVPKKEEGLGVKIYHNEAYLESFCLCRINLGGLSWS